MLKGPFERYVNADRHQQRMLYDHARAAPDFAIRDPVLVRTRGHPTGSTRCNLSHFEHVENGLNPTRRRLCGRCGHSGHNASTCRHVAQDQTSSAEPPALRRIGDIAHFDPVLDAVNAAANIKVLM